MGTYQGYKIVNCSHSFCLTDLSHTCTLSLHIRGYQKRKLKNVKTRIRRTYGNFGDRLSDDQ